MNRKFQKGFCLALMLMLLCGCSSAFASEDYCDIQFSMMAVNVDNNTTLDDIANDTTAGGFFFAAIATNIFSLDEDTLDKVPVVNLFQGANFIAWNEDQNNAILFNYDEASGMLLWFTYVFGDSYAVLSMGQGDFTLDELRAQLPTMVTQGLISGLYELSDDDISAGIAHLESMVK